MNKLEYAIRLILDNNDTIWYHKDNRPYLVCKVGEQGIECFHYSTGKIYLDKNKKFKIEEMNRWEFGATYNLVKKKSPKKIRRLR